LKVPTVYFFSISFSQVFDLCFCIITCNKTDSCQSILHKSLEHFPKSSHTVQHHFPVHEIVRICQFYSVRLIMTCHRYFKTICHFKVLIIFFLLVEIL
jgi:hypothetical protein